MVKRYGPRVELTCKVILAGDQSYCEGRVLDVSLPGCLIECVHPLPLRVGDYVRLRLFLPDQARPMNVPLAAVRSGRQWQSGCRVYPFVEGRSGQTGYANAAAYPFC